MSRSPPAFMERSILHLDVDAFFAAIEQRDQPRLRGKPVAVGTGVVASCSYEAKRLGVTTAMRLSEARRRCPSLIVLAGEYPRYEQAARRIQAICLDRTPLVESVALDDLYLDVSAQGYTEPELQRWAGELRQNIRDEVEVSVSIGIGSNKLVSRVATRQAKQKRLAELARPEHWSPSAGIALVPAGTERTYLAPWPVGVLPGLGGRRGEPFRRLNVRTVGEVAAMPAALLEGLLGRQGRQIGQLARGIDPRPVEPHRPQQSVSRSTSFEPPVAELDFLEAMLGYLLERAASWLRFRGLATRGLTLSIRYGDYRSETGRESFRTPTSDDGLLKEAARDRLHRLYQRRLPLRWLGIELAPLVTPPNEGLLFVDLDKERQQRLLEVKDQIRRRFGFTSLLSGQALLLDSQLERDRENFRLRTPCLTR